VVNEKSLNKVLPLGAGTALGMYLSGETACWENLIGRAENHTDTTRLATGCTTRSMDISIRRSGNVIMQNLVNLLDIKTTSSNISSNKDRVASGSEALE
jgi:hypothetical protein